MIPVSCPECGRRYQAKEEAAGKRTKCRGCGRTIWIREIPRRPSKMETTVQLQQDLPVEVERRRVYVWGLLFSLAVWSTLTYYIVAIFVQADPIHSETSSSVAFFVSAVFYVALLIESFRSATFAYLWRLNWVEDVIAYIERIKTHPPRIGWYLECFHFETRTRTVTEYYTEYEQRYDSTSQSYQSVPVQKTRDRLETYQERVVTHSESASFQYGRCEDISGNVSDEIYKFQATRIDFSQGYEFGDPDVSKRYNEERYILIAHNQNRDSGFHFVDTLEIDGYHPKMLAIVDMEKKPLLMHWSTYVASTVLTVSWFHRRWIDRETVKGHFAFRKRIFDH